MKFIFQLCIATWNGIVGIINIFIGKANKKAIENNNRINRGVTELNTISIGSLFESGCLRNSVISGSELFVRNQILINAILHANSNRRAVVILHESNYELERTIASQIANCIIIDKQNCYFDPFYSRSASDIAKMILTIAKKEYGIKDEARYAIKGMVDFLIAKKKSPTLSALASCPYTDLYDKVDEMVYRGKMKDSIGNNIKSCLSSGQSEYIKLKSFFDDLIDECGAAQSKSNIIDLLTAITEHKIIVINVENSTNKHYISSLVYQLEIALRSNLTFSFVLDGISITNELERLRNFISSSNTNCSVTLSSSDMYSMLNCDEKLMYTVLGNSIENVVMQHGSAVSAEEWSKAIGYYEKTETTTTVSKGKTKGGFSLFPSYSDTQSLAYSTKREPIVKSEEILRMANNELYIYDRSLNQLSHCFAVN